MICEKNKCTGCFACYNICPKKAIEMKEDECGFIYPEVDTNKCIKCGLCEKVCPSINKTTSNNPQKCFALFSNDSEIRKNSTSGGVATELSKYFINNGGIVYGACFKNNCLVRHTRIDKLEDLKDAQGSKYVHSYINDVFLQVKQDLKNKKVLFIGTPCQIAGLKKFLMKDYDNLFLIDLICHGVPSQKFLQEEVIRLVGTTNVDRVIFRKNNEYGFYIIKNGKIIFSKKIDESPYDELFMEGLSLRNNCHNCQYSNKNRVSDITIGDFWGLSEKSKIYSEQSQGINVVLCNTEKGVKLIEIMKNNFAIDERNIEEAVNGNTQLRVPINKLNKAIKFQENYKKYGFIKAYKKAMLKKIIKKKLGKIKRKVKKVFMYE